MGRRGPSKTPTAKQIAYGDPRKVGKKKLEAKLASEPAATRGLPECPERLQGLAREMWEFWEEELDAMNLSYRPDAVMLEGACVFFERAVQADGEIRKDGLSIQAPIISKKTGEILGYATKPHPSLKLSEDSWKLCRAFCSEFGLSPVSRTRLTIERKDNGEGDLMALLSQPRAAAANAVN